MRSMALCKRLVPQPVWANFAQLMVIGGPALQATVLLSLRCCKGMSTTQCHHHGVVAACQQGSSNVFTSRMTSAACLAKLVGSSRCVGMPSATEKALAVPRGMMPRGMPVQQQGGRQPSLVGGGAQSAGSMLMGGQDCAECWQHAYVVGDAAGCWQHAYAVSGMGCAYSPRSILEGGPLWL
jgi:hypothetical protein